ncbi:MAG: hypothetical protein ACI4XD_02260 [Clostridia bacterium]
MSSLKMHIAISKKIKDELCYSNLFLVGSILPDIIKLILGEKTSSHFEINNNIDLDKYILAQDNLKDELILGYYAHLIEDKIWFESYMNKKYRKLQEYSDYKLYNDYAFVDNLMYKKLDINTQDIGQIIFENIDKIDVKAIHLMNCKNKYMINNKSVKEKIREVWKDYATDGNNYFYTPKDAREYYQLSSQEVKEHLIKLK